MSDEPSLDSYAVVGASRTNDLLTNRFSRQRPALRLHSSESVGVWRRDNERDKARRSSTRSRPTPCGPRGPVELGQRHRVGAVHRDANDPRSGSSIVVGAHSRRPYGRRGEPSPEHRAASRLLKRTHRCGMGNADHPSGDLVHSNSSPTPPASEGRDRAPPRRRSGRATLARLGRRPMLPRTIAGPRRSRDQCPCSPRPRAPASRAQPGPRHLTQLRRRAAEGRAAVGQYRSWSHQSSGTPGMALRYVMRLK